MRTNFSFQFKLSLEASETAGDFNDTFFLGTTFQGTEQWWNWKFHSGDKSVEDDGRNGRPSNTDNDQLRSLVNANPHTTVCVLSTELNIAPMKISGHLKDIGL